MESISPDDDTLASGFTDLAHRIVFADHVCLSAATNDRVDFGDPFDPGTSTDPPFFR